jgi:hypothetical protein
MQTKYAFTLLAGLLFFYLTAFAQPPANDECSGAINVPVNANTTCYTFITGTTVGATQSGPGCDGDADDDVWYKFTTLSAGMHYITITPAAVNGINDVTFEVFLGDCSSLSSFICANNTTGNSAEIFGTGGSTGATFYFKVYSHSANAADRGDFEVCIKQAINPLNLNLLNNASFEVPVQTTNGDHVLASIPEWSTSAGLQPNIIRADGTAYASGPDTAHRGNQYIELSGGNGYLTQNFTLTGNTSINFGGWFSRREASGNAFNSFTEILDDNNDIVSTSSTVSFDCCESQEVWKNVNGTATLPAGNYTFNVQLNDYANFDSAFVVPFDPNAPTVSIAASQTFICANANVTFTATAVNVNGTPTYQWMKNGVNIIDAVNGVYNDNTLAANDEISCKLLYTDGNGNNQTIISNSILISINTNCYCIPPGGGGANNYYNISNVTINNLSNPTSNSTFDSYNDYSSTVIFNSEQATLVNFNVTTPVADSYKRIWIDLNDNMSFDDPGELMFATINKNVASVNGSFFIPADAPAGNHRLRVRANQQPFTNSCDQSYGETEDYTIYIGAGINCSGTPSASLAFASQYVICSGGNTNVTAYSNGLGITYQWQKSESPNSGFTDIPGAVNSTYATPAIIADTTYYQCIFTCAASGGSGASPVLAITIGAVPANDNICNAITLTQDVFEYQNTTCATVSGENFPGADECSTPNNTVWYKITPAVRERLRLKLNKVPNDPYAVDAWVSIFRVAGTCPNLVLAPVSPYPFNCLRANLPNDSSVIVEAGTYGSLPPSASGILEADTTYYIRIDGYIGSFGAFGITSLTPAITTNTWTGTASDQWEDVNNWSNLRLPDANTNVIINSNTVNNPKIDSNVTIRSLKLNSGITLTVLPGKILTVLH